MEPRKINGLDPDKHPVVEEMLRSAKRPSQGVMAAALAAIGLFFSELGFELNLDFIGDGWQAVDIGPLLIALAAIWKFADAWRKGDLEWGIIRNPSKRKRL